MAFKFNRIGKGKGSTQVILFSVIALTVILFIVLYVRQGHMNEGFKVPDITVVPESSLVLSPTDFGSGTLSLASPGKPDSDGYKGADAWLSYGGFYNGSFDSSYLKTPNNKAYYLFDYDYVPSVINRESGKPISLTNFNNVTSVSNIKLTATAPTGTLLNSLTATHYLTISVFLTFNYIKSGSAATQTAYYAFVKNDTHSESLLGTQNASITGYQAFFNMKTPTGTTTTTPVSNINNSVYTRGYFLRLLPTPAGPL